MHPSGLEAEKRGERHASANASTHSPSMHIHTPGAWGKTLIATQRGAGKEKAKGPARLNLAATPHAAL